MKMNKITCAAVALSMAFSATAIPTAATEGAVAAMQVQMKDIITISVDNSLIDCGKYGQNPVIVEGRTLVPLRSVFEALGASVEWNNDERSVTSVKDGVTVVLKVDSKEMTVNGEVKILDVPAMIMNERTMVPVRAVAEAFGATVLWDNTERCVVVKTVIDALSPLETVKKAYDAVLSFNYEDAAKYFANGAESLGDYSLMGSVHDIIASITSEEVSEEEEKMIEKFAKDVTELIKVEVGQEKIDGDSAEVCVKLTVPNFEMMDLDGYLTEDVLLSLYERVLNELGYSLEDLISADEKTSEEIQNTLVKSTLEYMIEAIEKETEKVGCTVTEDIEKLVKIDGKWLIKE